ncbi:putative cytoplasmic protein [Denitrovibrio acetiphilus DSM 12809]|uniref:Putative cytoplasmic protein n=2 Tax=Denitrovibrio TaxID=117999 RepID=D4H446_DENA2|nr:putative cytoplasmic protein [Denitrovibrio acetiphilus DSM 12809]
MRVFFIMIAFVVPLFAKDLGTFGTTYGIAEKDIITEIEKRASETDWQRKFEAEKDRLRKEAGMASMSLPPADKDRSYYVDMTYTLDKDIPKVDTTGKIIGVLYSKGFTYNPLDYADITETYVILNGKREAELQWFSKYYKDDYRAYPLITEGDAFEVAEKLGRGVFKLDSQFRERFSIENTVSVIYEDFSRKMMRVDVIKVKDEKNSDNNISAVSK